MIIGVINKGLELEAVAIDRELCILKRQRPALHILVYPRVVGIADVDDGKLIPVHREVEAVLAIGDANIIHILGHGGHKVEAEVLATSNGSAINEAILRKDNPVVAHARSEVVAIEVTNKLISNNIAAHGGLVNSSIVLMNKNSERQRRVANDNCTLANSIGSILRNGNKDLALGACINSGNHIGVDNLSANSSAKRGMKEVIGNLKLATLAVHAQRLLGCELQLGGVLR